MCSPIIFFSVLFLFSIDIIDNVIFKLIIMSPELPQLIVQYSGLVSLSASRDQYTAHSLVGVLATLYELINYIINYIY